MGGLMGGALVSIGMPTYNRAAGLSKAVASVLVQDYPFIEIIISDNASSDGTEAFCRELCDRYPQITYIRQPINQGPTPNFQTVLKQSQGEFFMWLADDDWLAEVSFIRECVEWLGGNPDYALVGGVTKCISPEGLERVEMSTNLSQASASERVMAYYGHVTENGVFYGLMRRGQLVRVPLLNTMGGDWLVVAAIAFMGKVKTLDSISLKRNRAGASSSYENIALVLGLPDFQARHPHLSIVMENFRQVVWRCEVYRSVGLRRRLWLAGLSGVLIWGRSPLAGRIVGKAKAVVRGLGCG